MPATFEDKQPGHVCRDQRKIKTSLVITDKRRSKDIYSNRKRTCHSNLTKPGQSDSKSQPVRTSSGMVWNSSDLQNQLARGRLHRSRHNA